jgi:ClpP class serine protease
MPISTAKHHPVTGCRMDTILGDWLMDQSHLQKMVDMGWMIVENGQLQVYSEKSAAMNAEEEDKPFTVNDGLARLSISGPMTKYDTSMRSLFGGCSMMRVRESLVEIRRQYHAGMVKGVFIDADSNGGTCEGTAELAAAIRKTAKIMPVFIHAEDKANSACLWVATQGTRFTCGPTASVGSQGTRMTMYDTSGSESEKRQGKPVVFETGKHKSIGHPGLPITPENKAEIQRWINNLNEPFKNDVVRARKLTPEQTTEVATARVFVGADAKRVGLVDAVCTADEAYDYATQRVNNTPNPARRGPGMDGNIPAAPRSSLMPLSAQQLDQLRKLPGAQNATEDNADEIALTVADTQHKAAVAARNSLTVAEQQRDEAKAALVAAQAKIPTTLDPKLAKGFLGIAEGEAGLLVKQGNMTSAQMKLVCDSLFREKDGSPNLAMFTETAEGKMPYKSVLAVFESNAPTGINKDITKAQPASKTEPGRVDAGTVTVPTLSEFNKARAEAGLSPATEADYKIRFKIA